MKPLLLLTILNFTLAPAIAQNISLHDLENMDDSTIYYTTILLARDGWGYGKNIELNGKGIDTTLYEMAWQYNPNINGNKFPPSVEVVLSKVGDTVKSITYSFREEEKYNDFLNELNMSGYTVVSTDIDTTNTDANQHIITGLMKNIPSQNNNLPEIRHVFLSKFIGGNKGENQYSILLFKSP
jgi:hypothetical protein